MDALSELSPFAQFGLVGTLVIMTLLAFARGWVFSRKSVEDMIQVYKDRIEDKNAAITDLKAAIAASEERNEMLNRQVAQLVELGRTSNAVLNSLPGGRAAP